MLRGQLLVAVSSKYIAQIIITSAVQHKTSPSPMALVEKKKV